MARTWNIRTLISPSWRACSCSPHWLQDLIEPAENNAALVANFFLPIGSLSFIRALSIKRKFRSFAGIEHVRQLSWRQFESIVGEAFRRRGYVAMENAVDGPDGGIDLVLRKDGAKFYVQCKQWKQTKIGVKLIRELYG